MSNSTCSSEATTWGGSSTPTDNPRKLHTNGSLYDELKLMIRQQLSGTKSYNDRKTEVANPNSLLLRWNSS